MMGGKAGVHMIDSAEETATPNRQRSVARQLEGSTALLDVLPVPLAEM
jgi:hypothetical protein